MTKRQTITIFLLVIIAIILLITKLTLLENLTTDGVSYNNIQSQIAEYKKSNSELHDQLLQDEAYNTIMLKAHQEGYVKADFIYLR